jgi:hypothetical protein
LEWQEDVESTFIDLDLDWTLSVEESKEKENLFFFNFYFQFFFNFFSIFFQQQKNSKISDGIK